MGTYVRRPRLSAPSPRAAARAVVFFVLLPMRTGRVASCPGPRTAARAPHTSGLALLRTCTSGVFYLFEHFACVACARACVGEGSHPHPTSASAPSPSWWSWSHVGRAGLA